MAYTKLGVRLESLLPPCRLSVSHVAASMPAYMHPESSYELLFPPTSRNVLGYKRLTKVGFRDQCKE